MKANADKDGSRSRDWVVPAILVVCALLVGAWELMARASRRPFRPFDLTAAEFKGFQPILNGYPSRLLPVSTNDPAEPNIVALDVPGRGGQSTLVRLVHGYNMPTCLRLKSYEVTLVQDVRAGAEGSAESGRGADVRFPMQVWRVKDPAGDVSVWVSSMLRAGDFAALPEDIRAMAFPRIDSPDDPNWIPQGITRESLRHPVAAFKGWSRARWNSSRTDWLTFLRLRQPAWASEERLSFVVRSVAPAVTPANEASVTRSVVAVHHAALSAFQQWRKTALPSN